MSKQCGWGMPLMLVGAACLLASPGASVLAAELLQNGSFEGGFHDAGGGRMVANGWEPSYRPEAAAAGFSSKDWGSPLGLSQKVNSIPLGSEAGICQRVTGLSPGAFASFTIKGRRNNAHATLWIAIDPEGNLPTNTLPTRTTELIAVPYDSNYPTMNPWGQATATATVGSSGTVCVYAWACQLIDAGACFFDDASLVTVARPVIQDLSISSQLSDAIELSWTAPPAAAKYEIRYSSEVITGENWPSATPVLAQVPPLPLPGAAQKSWVRGLTAGHDYYFAIRCLDSLGTAYDLSNSPHGSTTPPGSPPYWARSARQKLQDWYTSTLDEAQWANTNTGSTAQNPDNSFKWYYGSLDQDCEHQPPACALLQIVRDDWLLGFLRDLSDHVWDHTYANTYIEEWSYLTAGVKVPVWNESHHAGELTWNGVGLMALDCDNAKWLNRAVEYCKHFDHWTGYTGDAETGGPHLHFKSFFFKGDAYDYSAVRPYTLVDNPEDRRMTRSPFYAVWKDPEIRMTSGRKIKDFLFDLDLATAQDAARTDLDKPVGLVPGEVRYDNHQIGGYSGLWWHMAASLDGTVGGDNERWWDWGAVGWVQARDAYFELIDQHLLTGDPRFIAAVRETIRHFSVDEAINNIPPQYMFVNGGPYEGPIFPWPDYNDPWGGYQYIINLLYRQVTGDTQFDQAWLGHAQTLWQVLPPPGAQRCQTMIRSTLRWVYDAIDHPSWKGSNPFFLAWKITGDKEWLCRALDEDLSIVALETMYTGMPAVGINRLPDQPITWQGTNSNFAALVLDWDSHHVRWLACNFDSSDRPVQIVLWSLAPGDYLLRHGPDLDQDDQLDAVTESTPFTYVQRRTPLDITLPAGRMELFEIIPATCPPGEDADLDGVVDACDDCPNTVPGAQVDSRGCPPRVPGDFDRDGDVDQLDFAHFQACLTPPGRPPDDSACMDAKLDADVDVDQDDFAVFQRCMSGPNTPADPSCGSRQ